MLNTVFVTFIQGIILGGSYGAIAVGLSLIFGVTRIINFAHGSMLMMSMFGYYALYMLFGLSPYLGIIIIAPIMYLFGHLTQNYLLKPLIQRERSTVVEPVSILIITVALNIAIQNLFMMFLGGDYRTINTPIGRMNLVLGEGAFVVQWARVIAFFGSIVLTLLIYTIINKTELGLKIQAVSQNRDAAALCGVDVYRTYNIAFGIGLASVAVAGSLVSQFFFISPDVGIVFGTKAFLIVVLGGLGSIPGALLGGFIFGIVESVGAQFITSSSASMLTFLLFIIVLMVRPKGLLGKI